MCIPTFPPNSFHIHSPSSYLPKVMSSPFFFFLFKNNPLNPVCAAYGSASINWEWSVYRGHSLKISKKQKPTNQTNPQSLPSLAAISAISSSGRCRDLWPLPSMQESWQASSFAGNNSCCGFLGTSAHWGPETLFCLVLVLKTFLPLV